MQNCPQKYNKFHTVTAKRLQSEAAQEFHERYFKQQKAR